MLFRSTPLIFSEDESSYTYEITEPLSGEDIDIKFKIVNNVDINAFDKDNPGAFDKTMPNQIQIYRMRLAYGNLEDGVTVTIQTAVRTATEI